MAREGGKEGRGRKQKSGRKREKEKSADRERDWGSTNIPPTQTHPVLIFVIFLALWTTVVGRTVCSLMVCMTGCHGLRGGFPLPQRMPLPSLCGDPRLSSPDSLSPVLFLIHPSAISSPSFPFNPVEKTNQPGPSCAACYTYSPAGIHCLQLVPRHVFDSMRTCIRANWLVGVRIFARVSGCKCEQTSELKHISRGLYDQQKIRQPGKTIEGHRSEQVQLLRTIHQYAEQVLEQAQQKNMAKKVKAEKKNVVLTRRERKICLYNPPVSACQLSAGCW